MLSDRDISERKDMPSISALKSAFRVLTTLITTVVGLPAAVAVEYTTPRQLNILDVYQLNTDGATGDEATTEPKIDLNDGQNGDNPCFRRTNVARAHLGGCVGRYWYTSSHQEPGEPDPAGPQYVDYAPPFGPGADQLTPGRYRLNAEYRNTASRATYPAEYIIYHAGGATTVLKSQRDGVLDSCPNFDLGEFDLVPGSYIRVNDTGSSSITFNRMRFTFLAPAGGVPQVDAGPDQTIMLPAVANLDGTVFDPDGGPNPLTVRWSQTGGPGTVTFGDPNAVDTTAAFSQAGAYTLRLTASDGVFTVSDEIVITVKSSVCDFDGDTDVDQVDFGHLQACATGSGQAVTDVACFNAILDGDDDIDQNDFAVFAACVSGPDVPAAPECRGA